MNYTTGEVAAMLHLDESRIRRLARSRSLGTRFGRVWVFSEADIEGMRVRVTGRPKRREPVT